MPATIIINKNKSTPKSIQEIINAFNTDDILIKTGGYLFKCFIQNNEFHFGCIPWFVENQRTYHYNIPMKYENPYAVIGSIIKGGIICLLFKPESSLLSTDAIKNYRQNISCFAEFLLYNGFTNSGTLDEVSRQMLSAAKLWNPAPKTLHGLSE